MLDPNFTTSGDHSLAVLMKDNNQLNQESLDRQNQGDGEHQNDIEVRPTEQILVDNINNRWEEDVNEKFLQTMQTLTKNLKNCESSVQRPKGGYWR